MKKFTTLSIFFLLFILWVLSHTPVYAAILTGYVVDVLDGDTIKVLLPEHQLSRIRLTGIDAPEKKQPYGMSSKINLSHLIFGKEVQILTEKEDRYHRMLGKILYHGIDINLQQIKDGMAWHYRQYAKEQDFTDRVDYFREEQEARKYHVGLWKDLTPIAPWNFRHNRNR